MKEIERIVDQLDRAFGGDAWHGPSVGSVIDEVTAQQAAARPIKGGHSIWEIVLHIAAWERACRSRLQGDREQLSATEDWPPLTGTGPEAWEETRTLLKQGHDDLRAAVVLVDESRLDGPIIEGMSTVYVTLHGIIQHDLYHAGQIAILKKASAEVATL